MSFASCKPGLIIFNMMTDEVHSSETFVCLKRITIPEIKHHPWFLKNLPREISEREKANYKDADAAEPAQAVDEIMRIVQEAKTPGDMSKVVDPALLAEIAELESDDEEADADDTY
jgi:serine/threonine-protein kinase SRK2